MFSDWIKSLESKGMKLYEIANIIGVTYQTVQCYRDKNVYPTVTNVIKLSNYFNISVDEILNYPIKTYNSLNNEEQTLINNYNILSEKQKGEIDYHIKQLMESQQNRKRDVV